MKEAAEEPSSPAARRTNANPKRRRGAFKSRNDTQQPDRERIEQAAAKALRDEEVHVGLFRVRIVQNRGSGQ